MTDREASKSSESIPTTLANRETMAPSGLSDSTPRGTEQFANLPTEFGRFRMLKLLGQGAMGAVYLAFDPDLNKEVALKIPKEDLNQNILLWERFQREARAVGDLNHGNICGMYEVGQRGTTHYIEMEYVDGRPLSDYITAGQPQRKVVSVIRKLAAGLAQAHERGIVHRDLKPANVMIDSTGEPKLMDFGLARRMDLAGDVRATQSGMIVGSPAYMAPEQARAQHDMIGPKTDIYGLGVLFFEMLTGSLPFRGPMVVVLAQIATQLPPRPSSLRADLDPQLESLCLKMLAKQPQDRPVSMDEIVQVLTDWLKSDSASNNDSASNPKVMAIAKEEPLLPARRAPAILEKADPADAQKQKVNDLLGKYQYAAAIELLEKIVNLRDARFEKLVAWGRGRLAEVKLTEQKMREASAPLCATADKLLKRHDYTEAVKILSSVPSQYRSAELRAMLRQATEWKVECDQLEQDLAEAIQSGDADILPALVKRLLKLKPGSRAVRNLAADLQKMGARKVIALRQGQRRFLDGNERIIESHHIVGSIALILMIFAGVSLLVRNYLATSNQSADNGKIDVEPPKERDPEPDIKPPVVVEVDVKVPPKPVEIAAGEVAERQQRIELARKEATGITGGHVITGQVVVDGHDDPAFVTAQMRILDSGFFAGATADLDRPIGFRMHQYAPFELTLKGLAGEIVDVGVIKMRRLPPGELVPVKGRIVLEGSSDASAANVTLSVLPGPINTPSNGVEAGIPKRAPPIPLQVSSSGDINALGFSPIDYYCSISAPGHVSRQFNVTLLPGIGVDLGTVSLARVQTELLSGAIGQITLPAEVSHARISPDAQSLLVIAANSVSIRDARTLKQRGPSHPLTGNLKSSAFSQNSRWCVVGSHVETANYIESGRLMVIDASSGEIVGVPRKSYNPFGVWISSDGQHLKSILPGSIHTMDNWQTNSFGVDAQWATYVYIKSDSDSISDMAFAADGKSYLTLSPAKEPPRGSSTTDLPQVGRLWTTSRLRPVGAFSQQDPINNATFSADGRMLAVGSGDHVTIWSTNTFAKPKTDFQRHRGTISAVALDARGKLCASSAGDRVVRIWGASDGVEVRTPLPHDGDIVAIGFSSDATELAAMSAHGIVYRWQASP